MNLKKQLMAIENTKDARELADALLKLHPGDDDAVEEHALELLLVVLVLSASEQGDNCLQFLLDRINESDPREWLSFCRGDAKSELEGLIQISSENFRKQLALRLNERLGPYVRMEATR